MPFNDNDPFAGVDFNTPLPVVTADDMSTILKSFNAQGMPLVNNVSGPSSIKLNVAAVNENTADTGVVGYRDSKGQANFTNVARDPATNKEVKLGQGTVPANDSPVLGQPNEMAGQPAPINTPNGINSILASLASVQDAGAARGLFSSFQEAAAKEQVRLQTEALTFAQQKIGIPGLEKNLAQVEATDKASIGWYPGIGDSPVTQKARTELNLARGYADTEAKRLLENNLSYKLLAKNVVQAEKEMQRVQAAITKKEQLEDRKSQLADNRTLQNDEWNRRKEYQEAQEAESISATQLARIQFFSAQDFVGEANPRVKAYKLLKGNKDKEFQAAVNAADGELPVMALRGNGYAETLVLSEESKKTGMPQAQVKAQLDAMRKVMSDPKFEETVINQRFKSEKDGKTLAATEKGRLQAMKLNPTEKEKFTEEKARMAFEWMQQKKTQTYINDTTSWNSIDPVFKAAQDKALKTTGSTDLNSTLVAYLGDLTGPERLQKLGEFEAIARSAAKRHEGSMFGMPDYRAAGKMIAAYGVEEGIFKKWLAAMGAKSFNAQTGLLIGGPQMASVGALWDLSDKISPSRAIRTAFEPNGIFAPDKTAINPLTNKPFGEE